MEGCNISVTPKLEKECEVEDEIELEPQEAKVVRTIICRLLYLSSLERSDISSTVRVVCKSLKTPTKHTSRQIKKLLRYLKGSRDKCTFYDREPIKTISGYVDSDWASCKLTRKSVSGCVVLAGGARVHSHARGQPTVALSSCEAEIIAASEGAKELLFVQKIFEFLDFGLLPIEMWIDSSSARAFAHREGVGRMKHLDTRYLWLQNLVKVSAVHLKKIPRAENVGDLLTHVPTTSELRKFTQKMGMVLKPRPLQKPLGLQKFGCCSTVALLTELAVRAGATDCGVALEESEDPWGYGAYLGIAFLFAVMIGIFMRGLVQCVRDGWIWIRGKRKRLDPRSRARDPPPQPVDQAVSGASSSTAGYHTTAIFVVPGSMVFHTCECLGLKRAKGYRTLSKCSFCAKKE